MRLTSARVNARPNSRSALANRSDSSPASPPGVPTTPPSSRPSTHESRPCSKSAASFTRRISTGSPTWAQAISALRPPAGIGASALPSWGRATWGRKARRSRQTPKPMRRQRSMPPRMAATNRRPARSASWAATAELKPSRQTITTGSSGRRRWARAATPPAGIGEEPGMKPHSPNISASPRRSTTAREPPWEATSSGSWKGVPVGLRSRAETQLTRKRRSCWETAPMAGMSEVRSAVGMGAPRGGVGATV